jgi:two-component system cell cycle sensor histidine kinase/response regulator CckA
MERDEQSDDLSAHESETLSLLRSALESTTDGLLMVDNDGKVVGSNRRFRELWRIPRELAAARDDDRLLEFVLDQLQEPDAFLAKVRELYANPKAESFDVLEFKDGRVFERYSRPQLLGGESVGRVWSFRDVTERRRVEEELRQSQKMDAIGRLAGGIAHDFNNLLHVIINAADFLASDAEVDALGREEIATIRGAAERGRDLVGQLLAFTREQLLRFEVINVNKLITEMRPLLKTTVGEEISLELALNPHIANIRADPLQLKQVILNLILNAREAMATGGKLSIETSSEEPRVHAEGDLTPNYEVEPGKYICVTVRDTGIGIAPDIAGNIFDPFFTTKPRAEAAGLGLSTVFGIVKGFGGYISVFSPPDVGTTVQVFLRAVEAEAPSRVSRSTPSLKREGKTTVLVVEDEPAVLKLTSRILTRKGFEVVGVHTPSAALQVFGDDPDAFDVVFSDVVLPEISGPELVGKLKEIAPGIGVVYMSGYAPDVVNRHGMVSQEAVMLQKPFSAEEVVSAINSAIAEDVR